MFPAMLIEQAAADLYFLCEELCGAPWHASEDGLFTSELLLYPRNKNSMAFAMGSETGFHRRLFTDLFLQVLDRLPGGGVDGLDFVPAQLFEQLVQ